MAFDEEEVDFDFDAAWADRIQTKPRIRLKGVVYELPPVIPAKLILYISKSTKGKKATDEVDVSAFPEMLALIFGKENATNIMNSGVGVDELPEVMETVQRIYMDRAEKNIAKNRKAAKPGN